MAATGVGQIYQSLGHNAVLLCQSQTIKKDLLFAINYFSSKWCYNHYLNIKIIHNNAKEQADVIYWSLFYL